MKNIVAIAMLLCSSVAFSQVKNFTVSGNIKGLDSKNIYITMKDSSAPRGFFRDSIPVNNGAFSYSMNIKKMTYLTLSPGVNRVVKKVKSGGYFPAKSSLLQFFANPGGMVHFTGEIKDFVDAYPSGDEANIDLARLDKQINPIGNKSVNLMVKMADSIIVNPDEIKATKDEIGQLDKKENQIKIDFIKDNPSSIAAAWLLSDMMIRTQVSNDDAIQLFKKMNKEKLVSTPFYAEIAKRVDGIVATKLGNEVPAINTKNTFDKQPFELKSLRGKYVVIDFWGTWCGPCISGMPKMKEYLNKYNGKLDIVGVAQESDDGTQWRKFLDKNTGYNWHQVLSRPNEDYILKFSVAGFPTKIIVDPQGAILARYVGEDNGFYEKLDQVLKN